MDNYLLDIINRLPRDEKTHKNSTISKIRKYLPVPNDHKILWADISNLNGHPAGLVLTDKAIVIKSSKKDVNNARNRIKRKNKNLPKNQREHLPDSIYQIIPWEYYSFEDYKVSSYRNKKGEIKFRFVAGKDTLYSTDNGICLDIFNEYNAKLKEQHEQYVNIMNAIEAEAYAAINTVNLETVVFNAKFGVDNTKTGHGFYAEKYSSIKDKLSGEDSSVTGMDFAKNGPDKSVNGVNVQCKYCRSAKASINACFKTADGNSAFRYYNLDGSPMKIEVPADQYTEAINILKNRISAGEVKNVSDPNKAYDIVRKGKITYQQARNLAKAGNIDSIKFDAATGAVSCLSVLGISTIVTFAQVFWSTQDYKKAAKCALVSGVQVYGMAFAGSIVASQLARTGLTNALRPAFTNLSKTLSPKTVQTIVNAFRNMAGQKPIYGAAAQKSFTKMLGSNAITEGIMFLVFTIPDTYKILFGKISTSQYLKNLTSLLSSIGGSIAAGATVGGALGAIPGAVAGVAGGMIAGVGSRTVGNLIHEDDYYSLTRLFNATLINLMIEYMLDEQEQKDLLKALESKEKEIKKLMDNLLNSSNQTKEMRLFLDPEFEKILSKRNTITRIDEEQMENIIAEEVLKEGMNYEM